MKACVLKSNQIIVVEDLPLGLPKDNEVTVKVVSCGICGSDIPRYFSNAVHFYPLILGHEFFGVVSRLGSEITNLTIGDYVVGIPLVPCFECDDCKKGNYSLCKNYKFIGSSLNGAYCEELNINVKNLYKIDKKIASPFCALFEPSSIGLHAIKMFDGYKNKSVAIVGGGTIGAMVADWARIYGAKSVVLFEQSLNNLETYQAIGIYKVFESSEQNISYTIDQFTSGKGFDFVFDAAGVNQTIVYSLKLAANKGKVCYVGTPTKQVVFSNKEWEMINRKELLVTGSWMGYSNPFPGSEWFETEKSLLNGSLKFKKEHFAGFYNLKEVEKAFEFISNNKNGKVGRVCLITDFGKEMFGI